MKQLLQELRRRPLLWLLLMVPVLFVVHGTAENAHTLEFLLSIAAIVPLAALLSLATGQVAQRTGDMIGGLLNATLGNLVELVITLVALRAGEYTLVKAAIAGALVTNSLFMLGTSFLLGGLKHRVQEFNRANARLQAAMLLLATIALLVPSAVSASERVPAGAVTQQLSLYLSVLLIAVYALSLVFSLKTHKDLFASGGHGDHEGEPWPLGLAIGMLIGVTVLVAMVSHVFVESVQVAATDLGMTPAFVGFIVVALVGGAAEMISAFAAARQDRLDLSVSIALGSSAQIALFVAPVMVLASYFVAPQPMDLQFWPGVVVMVLLAVATSGTVTNTGRSSWFSGALAIAVYLVFAMTLFLLPPGGK